MKNLQEEIKNKKLAGIYIFYGDEDYLKNLYKSRIIKAFELEENSMNLSIFKDSFNEEALFNMINTMPFGAEKKLIILENTGILSSDICEKLLSAPDFCVILIVEEGIDKRTKGYKLLSKIAKITQFSSGDNQIKQALINSTLKKSHKRIDADAVRYLIDNSNNDLYSISNNLDKIIDFIDDEIIRLDDVKKIIPRKLSDKIFDMIRYITTHEGAKAIKIYRDLIMQKESPFKIIKLIYREYSILARLIDSKDKSNKELAKEIGMYEFSIKKYRDVLQGIDTKSIIRNLDKCIELEENIKSGKIGEKIGLEKFIIEILSDL